MHDPKANLKFLSTDNVFKYWHILNSE